MPLKPSQHFRVFVSSVIIDDGMDDLAGWNLCFDGVEEADELLMAVALHVTAGHGSIEDVEGGKWCRAACNRASWSPSGPSSSASRAGCGPEPGFGFFRQWKERAHVRAAPYKVRRYPEASQRIWGLSTA